MEASFEIKGLSELNKLLKDLPEDFRAKSLASAVGGASRLIRDEAKRLVPSDTGNLKGAIRAQKKKSPSKYIGKYQVNINPKGKVTILSRGKNRRSTSTYYGRMVEEGTSKMSPRPFMRTAFAFKKRDAVIEFQRILDKKIAFYQRKIERINA